MALFKVLLFHCLEVSMPAVHVCMSSNDERCTMANKVGVLAIVDIGGQPCTLAKIFGCSKILGGYVS